jgi:two-component system, LuxR family, response regulator FixJ
VQKVGLILIATRDGVLADSLRFSLELEGFSARLCDELSLFSSLAATDRPGCLVLDQDVFDHMVEEKSDRFLAESSIPVVLLVEASTQRLRDRARKAGIVSIVEKPRLGRVLLDAVEDAIDGRERLSPSGESRSGWRLPPFLRSSP